MSSGGHRKRDEVEDSLVTDNFLVKPKFTHFPVRVRPHLNPLSDSQRLFRGDMCSERSKQQQVQTIDAIKRYKHACTETAKRWLDLGCAFGGLLFELSSSARNTLLIGLEIRPACTQYSHEKIEFLTKNSKGTDMGINNLHFINCNVMRDLGRVITGQSIDKVFITYPDPHFKTRNIRRRLLSERMIPLIAFVLRRKSQPEGNSARRLYIATDVEELFLWMNAQMSLFTQLFVLIHEGHVPSTFDNETVDEQQRLKADLASIDSILPPLIFSSEDAKRCTRRKIDRYWAVYERK